MEKQHSAMTEEFNQAIEDEARRLGVNVYDIKPLEKKTLTAHNVRPADPLPYNSPGEAITDLATSLAEVAVKLVPPVGKLTVIAGVGYFLLSAIGGACAAAMAWGAANATMIGAVLVGLLAVWVAKSSVMDKRANTGGQTTNSATAQNINVTVNVAGQNVSNGKAQ